MSEYKNIIGTHIKTVTTDPPNPENGQMWYNSTTKVVKGFTSNPAGAWASGGALGTGRERGAGSKGARPSCQGHLLARAAHRRSGGPHDRAGVRGARESDAHRQGNWSHEQGALDISGSMQQAGKQRPMSSLTIP